MTTSEVLTVIALLAGPLLAVWVSFVRENRRNQRQRRLEIFRTLMATRATTLAPDHVRALNSINVDFYGVQPVMSAWKSYIDQLCLDPQPVDWGARTTDLLISLLESMAQTLGYQFDHSDINRLIYAPKGHAAQDWAQWTITEKLAEILSDKKPLRVTLVETPPAPAVPATPSPATQPGPPITQLPPR